MTWLIQNLVYAPLLNLLTFLIYIVPGHSAAVGVILLTLIVRGLLFIPTKKALGGQRKQQLLMPHIKRLQEEYGDDKQGLAAAQMALYKANGINPFGTLGVTFIQLIVLYSVFLAASRGLTATHPRLYDWLPRPESINLDLLGLDVSQPDRTFILIGITAILQYFQIKMSMPKEMDPKDPSMAVLRFMQYAAPVLLVIAGVTVPAAVVLYWAVSTLFGMVQQVYVNREKVKLEGLEVVTEIEKAPKKEKTLEGKGGTKVTVRKKS